MHPTQQKILELAKTMKINYKNPRVIGGIIGVQNPQNVKHHLEQLKTKGFINIDTISGVVTVNGFENSVIVEGLVKVPIYGSANCGPATVCAEENLAGYLAVPSSKIKGRSKDGLFIVIAEGDSMNNAKNVKGGPIENEDYVIVDSKNKNPSNGSYVLSVIDGLANLKRFYKNEKERRIELISESNQNVRPIYIDEEDFGDYMINGVVIEVIKKKKP